jgi:hypothetical protein
VRIPEGISAAWVKGFTSENVARFFDVYESELRRFTRPVHRISSVDETGISTVQYRHVNPLNVELNPLCNLLALLGARHFLHVSRVRVKIVSVSGKKEVASLP